MKVFTSFFMQEKICVNQRNLREMKKQQINPRNKKICEIRVICETIKSPAVLHRAAGAEVFIAFIAIISSRT